MHGISWKTCYFMPYTCPENSGWTEQWHGLECFVYHSIFLSSSMFLYGRSSFWHADEVRWSIQSLPFRGIPVIPQWDASSFSVSSPWLPFVTQCLTIAPLAQIPQQTRFVNLISQAEFLPFPSERFCGQIFTLTFSSWQVVVLRCSTNLQFGASFF